MPKENITVPIHKIKVFNSGQASHINVTRLNEYFQDIRHYPIYRKRLRKITGISNYGIMQCIEAKSLLKDMLSLSSTAELIETKGKIHHDLIGRIGSFNIHEEKIEFIKVENRDLVIQMISGEGELSFNFFLFHTISDILSKASEASKLYKNFDAKLNEISDLQKDIQKEAQSSRKQAKSELVLAKTASLFNELKEVTNSALDSKMRLRANAIRNEIYNIIGEQLLNINEYISDTLIFLSQFYKYQNSESNTQTASKPVMIKIGKDLINIAYFINNLEEIINEYDNIEGYSIENIRLNLYFCLILVPHEEIYLGQFQNVLENKLLYIILFSHFLHRSNLRIDTNSFFPKNTKLKFKYLPNIKGKKITEVINLLAKAEKASNDDLIMGQLRWQIFLDSELFLRTKEFSRIDESALLSLKRFIVQDQLKKYTYSTLQSVTKMLNAVKNETVDEDLRIKCSLPDDVFDLFRNVCFHFHTMLNDDEVVKLHTLYAEDEKEFYEIKKKKPKGKFARHTKGSISSAIHNNDPNISKYMSKITDALFHICNKHKVDNGKNIDLNKVIQQYTQNEKGGIFDILYNKEKILAVASNPIVKNQSMNQKRLKYMLNISRQIAKS